MQDQPGVAFGDNFTKEIPLNEFSENLEVLLKKKEGRVNFTKEIPLKEKVWKPQIFPQNYHLQPDTFSMIFQK